MKHLCGDGGYAFEITPQGEGVDLLLTVPVSGPNHTKSVGFRLTKDEAALLASWLVERGETDE